MLKGLFLRDQVMRSDIVFAVIIVFAPKHPLAHKCRWIFRQ